MRSAPRRRNGPHRSVRAPVVHDRVRLGGVEVRVEAQAGGDDELAGVVVEHGPEPLVGPVVARPHDADRLRRLVDHEVVGGRQRELFVERVAQACGVIVPCEAGRGQPPRSVACGHASCAADRSEPGVRHRRRPGGRGAAARAGAGAGHALRAVPLRSHVDQRWLRHAVPGGARARGRGRSRVGG